MIHRIDVRARDGNDPLGASIRQQIRDLGKHVVSVQCSRIFLLDTDADPAGIARIAGQLLADPIVESAEIFDPRRPSADAGRIEVHLKPGVMDPVAASTEMAVRDLGLGVVLVPTLVPGVNIEEIGAIIDFAARNTPCVRAVHFQPISYFGRYPRSLSDLGVDGCKSSYSAHNPSTSWPIEQLLACETDEFYSVASTFSLSRPKARQTPSSPRDSDRITLPEVMREIERQTAGRVLASSFNPGSAENAYCSFNGSFYVDAAHQIHPTQSSASCGCGAPPKAASTQDAVQRARQVVAAQWTQPAQPGPSPCCPGVSVVSFDTFLAERRRSLSISGMAFQDAWTLDLERLRDCFIHVVSPDQRVIPFCAYNLSATSGQTLYRETCSSIARQEVTP